MCVHLCVCVSLCVLMYVCDIVDIVSGQLKPAPSHKILCFLLQILICNLFNFCAHLKALDEKYCLGKRPPNCGKPHKLLFTGS